MILFDYIVAGLLLVAFVRGIVNGLLKEIASLLAIVLGIVAARLFVADVANYLANWLEIQPNVAQISAFALIFVLVALGLHIIAFLLKKFLQMLKMNFLNRFAGGLFGILKMAIIISLVLNLCDSLNNYFVIIKPETKAKSVLYQPLEMVAAKTIPFLQSQLQKS